MIQKNAKQHKRFILLILIAIVIIGSVVTAFFVYNGQLASNDSGSAEECREAKRKQDALGPGAELAYACTEASWEKLRQEDPEYYR